MAETKTTEHEFQAEVQQVLGIVINSLYSHKEIFLRELISNAADAIDKLRFRALTEHDLLGEGDELEIRITPDASDKTLTIADNGVGMTRDEMVQNLGTIAHSGSQRFLEAMKQKGQGGESVDLIGQFGVGFYSAFLVASRVEVTSRSADGGPAVRWVSEADGRFTTEEVESDLARGTEIRLHLADEQNEYADEWRLRNLVKRYSDFVSHPIRLRVEREEGEDDDKKTVVEYEQVNRGGALWKRAKSDVTDEDYEEFYKHLTFDFDGPLARTHFTIEGTQLFTGLLFVPKRPPFDLFDRDQRRGVRLYVKRVFIMDDCEELLPAWLRFVRGIIDSDDLPLNVSREILQEDKVVKSIRKGVVKKLLDLLESVAKDRPDDYRTLWDNYGPVLKEGLHFEPDHQERIAGLVRYASSKEDYTSLADYVERMPEGQEDIYYVIGPSRNAVEGSPHTEALRRKGYEVLYMTDAVDEWAVAGLPEFDGKKLRSAMKADLDLDEEQTDEEKEKKEETEKGLEGLTGASRRCSTIRSARSGSPVA